MSRHQSTTSTSSTTNLTLSGAQFSALGIGSGIDLQSIVSAMVQEYSQPQTALKNQLSTTPGSCLAVPDTEHEVQRNSNVAQALNIGYVWQVKAATSSDSSVSATASTTRHKRLAVVPGQSARQPRTSASYGYVGSTSTVVGCGYFSWAWPARLASATSPGADSPPATTRLPLHRLRTAQLRRVRPVADSITLNGTETLNATIDGQSKSFTLTAGTYNQ